MNQLEFFKKLRDISGEIVEALETENESNLESAMGRFLVLMLQADALK